MKKNFTRLFMGVWLIASVSAQAQEGLFISEVTDPADDFSGRFIELYNSGTEAVDFSSTTLFLSRQSNGGTGWGDVQLAGMVAPGATFVIGGSSFETVYGFAPDQVSGIIIGNGDDAYFLFQGGNHTAGSLHDIFGTIDTDGTGALWEYQDSRAVRVEGVGSPNILWTAAEWEIASANIVDTDPGTHHGLPVTDTLSEGNFSLFIGSDTIDSGFSFALPISVSELTLADNVISFQFDIDFDTTALEYTGSDLAGTLAEGGTMVINSNVAGKLSVGYMNTGPITGAGDILKLQFNSLTADTTELFLSNAYLNSNHVANLTSGIVIIRSINPPTAEITYSDTMNRFTDTLVITAAFSDQMDVANAVLLGFSGALSVIDAPMTRQSATVYTYSFVLPKAEGEVLVRLSNGTDLWGNEVDSVPTSGETFYIEKFTAGDVDDDGIILAYDAAITLQYSVGLDPLPSMDPLPWETWRDSTANVDGTGGITANDAGMILQFSAGLITAFPGGTKKSAILADVSVGIINNEIIIYSYGELLGFNLSTINENEILGPPVVMGENLNSRGSSGLPSLGPSGFMSAVNMGGKIYNIGLCTAYPPENGTAILKIPFNKRGSVTFRFMVNREEKVVTVDLATGIPESGREDISIYPNPAKDHLFIAMGDYYQKKLYALRIINQQGERVFEKEISDSHYEVHISELSGAGLYYLQVTDAGGGIRATRKFIVQ